MVSPHRDWDDVEAGYVAEDRGVFVEPAVVRFGDGLSTHLSGVSDAEANVYSVELRTRMGRGDESWLPVAHFVELRPAWEFAHLLTHYISSVGESAMGELRRGRDAVPDVIEETSAAEVFEALCGVPDGMEELVGRVVRG